MREKKEIIKLTADNFIIDEYSICREERQYALFLYNILRKYHTPDKREGNTEVMKIFDVCGIPSEAKVEHVFYEATLMRDFFERNRRLVLGKYSEEKLLNKGFKPSKRKIEDKDKGFKIEDKDKSFNAKLIKFATDAKLIKPVTDKDASYTDKEYNLGGNKVSCDDIVREMMNATPDIAVIYNENGQEYLLFIECKFESGEDTYESGKKQCEIQKIVADFLCNYLNELENSPKIEVSPKMENEKSRLVRFVRKEPNSDEILITDLIKLNDGIFSE